MSVWCTDPGKARSIFSKSFLKTQGIEILEDKPENSETVKVECCFILQPDKSISREACREKVNELCDAAELELYWPGDERMKGPLSLLELLNKRTYDRTRTWYSAQYGFWPINERRD